MLNQILPAGAVGQYGGLNGSRGVELVVAREDHALELLLGVALTNQVAPKYLEPALACQYLLPQVSGPMTALGVHRIALRAGIPQIERQELRGGAVEPGHHLHLAVADCEMDKGPTGERQQRFGGLALRPWETVEAVLVYGVLYALRKVGLELDGRDRNAVEEQHQVEAVLVVHRVAHLPNHPKPVGLVAGEDVWIHGQRRLELGQLQRLLEAEQFNAVPQHVQRAPLVKLVAQASKHRLGRLAAMIL